MRLAGIAQDNWRSVDGFAASQNMPDLREMPLDRFCSFIYWWATRNAEKEADIRKFEAQLWRPPVGVVPDAGSPWSAEAETSAFAALKKGIAAG